jgi:hypothetical protein
VILKGFGVVAFFAGVRASSFCVAYADKNFLNKMITGGES